MMLLPVLMAGADCGVSGGGNGGEDDGHNGNGDGVGDGVGYGVGNGVGNGVGYGVGNDDTVVSKTARYIQDLESDTWEASLAVNYRAESIAMCTGVDAGTVDVLLRHFGNSARRLAAASTLLLRERFGLTPKQALAVADFFSATEMVPPMIVYQQHASWDGGPSQNAE
jgi:hypothetical protein